MSGVDADDALRAIYAALAAEGLSDETWESTWNAALDALALATNAERVTLLALAPGRRPVQDSFPFRPEGTLLYNQHYADKDLRIARMMTGQFRGTISTTDMMTPEEIAVCPVHQDYYRIFPECWHSSFSILRSGPRLFVPAIQRSARWDAFDRGELRTLSFLAPHLGRAMELREDIAAGAITDMMEGGRGTMDVLRLLDGLEGVVCGMGRFTTLRVDVGPSVLAGEVDMFPTERGDVR